MSKVRTYANKTGFIEIRYHLGDETVREVVPEAKAKSRAAEIQKDLDKVSTPPTKKEIEELRAVKFLLPAGVSLLDVVRKFKATHDTTTKSFTELVDSYIAHETLRGVTDGTIRDKKNKLLTSRHQFPLRIQDTTPDTIADILANIPNAKTSNNLRSVLIGFFDWLIARAYYDGRNPVSLVSPRKGKVKDPVPFTPEELTKLLVYAESMRSADGVLLLALGAFAGMRQSEICRLRVCDIIKDEVIRDTINLSSDITKTSRRRCVDVTLQAKSWIGAYVTYTTLSNWIGFGKAPNATCITISNPNRLLREIAGEAGVKWKANGLRKGFISADAEINGIAHAAKQAGNTEGVSESNYKALFSESQAKQWFAILPG